MVTVSLAIHLKRLNVTSLGKSKTKYPVTIVPAVNSTVPHHGTKSIWFFLFILDTSYALVREFAG